MNRFHRGADWREMNESNAEIKIRGALQQMRLNKEIRDIGLSTYWIPVRMTQPDRVWLNQKVALYLDGDEVHDIDDPWDQEVDRTLTKMGWTVLRERYHAPLTQQRKQEILANIKEALTR